MKKAVKKLVLAKETIRDLMALDQARVRAGLNGTVTECSPDPNCSRTCPDPAENA